MLRRADAMWSTLEKSASCEDAAAVLSKLLGVAEKQWPGLQDMMRGQLGSGASQAQCATCKKLFTGLSTLAPFQASKLSADNMRARRYVDNLVKGAAASREVAVKLGYNVGRQRWHRASEPEKDINAGGRPSVINKEAAIAAVRAALEDKSQPSSSLCKKGDDWVVAKTLTERPSRVYLAPDVCSSMSETSFRRLLQAHMVEYRRPRLLTDYCQHCYDLDRKVMVDVRKAIQHWREGLGNVMENYFQAWDAHCAATNLSLEEQAGLYLRDFEHYISKHDANKPCARHQNSAFPCGLFELRKRGSGFDQKRRHELHEQEAMAGHELRALYKLLLGYLHHREAKEVQHASIGALLHNPPLGTVVLLSDWKELETLPQCWQATGDQFFAQARHEVSIWGAELVEHSVQSTAEKPDLVRTQLIVLSTILDHTALRTNQLIRVALQRRQTARKMERLCIVSDCGPHYRSLESCAHHLVTLHQAHGCSVEVHFGCDPRFSKHFSLM